MIGVRLVVALAVLGGAARGLAARDSAAAFPHARHERVFPVCEGCHEGIVTGDSGERYPTAVDCARCHDGSPLPRVAWRTAAPRASNLRFTHDRHLALLAASKVEARCQACHAIADGAARMAVGPPRPALCTRCHAHRASAHLAPEAACSRCHLPIAAARAVSTERIARFPQPPSHRAPDWGATHGRDAAATGASCATCHARESCARCHPNAATLAPVQALAPDARVASLVRGRAASYATPASHRAPRWGSAHGAAATRGIAGCANCHARAGCSGCHREPQGEPARLLATLPAADGGASGVLLAGAAATVHPADFARRHGSAAAADARGCTQCHAQRRCAACHAAADSRAFHPRDYAERHAAAAFGGSGECRSCHRSETFCRACHSGAGVATKGRMAAAYHDAQGSWLLSHGQAARLGLESCAGCHAQGDCIRCHSASGGWGVNPHRSGFAGRSMAARSAASCRLCHAGDPAGGR